MPDENKLKSLDDAMFQVKRTCYRCAHFDEGGRGWGTCRKITYEHKKHSGDERQASVPIDGWCPDHETWSEARALLGAHQQFIEKTGFPDPCECGQHGITVIMGVVFCIDCADRLRKAAQGDPQGQ